jgi:hypothetical protein
MDVEFLAAGALLERGVQISGASFPAVPVMLRATTGGEPLGSLLADYATLRRVESCARWLAGRAIETLPLAGETAALVADLERPGQSARELAAEVAAARGRIAAAFDRVSAKGSVDALSAGRLRRYIGQQRAHQPVRSAARARVARSSRAEAEARAPASRSAVALK